MKPEQEHYAPSREESIARREIAQVMSGLDPKARERVLHRVADQLPAFVEKHAANVQVDRTDDEMAATVEWLRSPFKLERNDCTRLHKVRSAFHDGFKIVPVARIMKEAPRGEGFEPVDLWSDVHTFVVQHDWAGAFERATFSDDHPDRTRLPFLHCAFEFRVSGRTVVLFARDNFEGDMYAGELVVQSVGDWWALVPPKHGQELLSFCWRHVRAICIALDAEVAAHDIVRGPPKLNEARARRGELPLYDYHVVRVHGRHTTRAPDMGGTHRSPRLHFRRGHWRHLATHTVWVKWCLAGDPDLGFIDKSYRL